MKNYPQNRRIFRPVKRQHLKDCVCPIQAEGRLGTEFLHQSVYSYSGLGRRREGRQWEAWGATKAPIVVEVIVPTVAYAAKEFLESQVARNLEASTYRAFSFLLNKRLVPFAAEKNITFLSAFDDLHILTKFIESWRNLNPLVGENVPLKDSSKNGELERLRSFLRYARERKWLKEDLLPKLTARRLGIETRTTKKFAMEAEEEKRLFDEILKFDGGGYNAEELHTFCLVMRQTGFRISDATLLNDTQLKPRLSGNGFALELFQKKTGEYVYMPITDDLEAALRKLKVKGEANGKIFWFWTTEGKPKTAVDNWYVKIKTVIDRVAAKTPFIHPASPHVLRHGFSVAHLNTGVPLKTVSRWLGHRTTSMIEKAYSHATRSTLLTSEIAFDESMKRQAP